ncbi:hypothetical protein ACCO45_013538 [Purpureocillium lilacinum]|uniref:Uncharacterized protein n=1 Tax=Purpureocillium lilacinum TaxID=33203 RepID=A0ACC4D8G9_PURLI
MGRGMHDDMQRQTPADSVADGGAAGGRRAKPNSKLTGRRGRGTGTWRRCTSVSGACLHGDDDDDGDDDVDVEDKRSAGAQTQGAGLKPPAHPKRWGVERQDPEHPSAQQPLAPARQRSQRQRELIEVPRRITSAAPNPDSPKPQQRLVCRRRRHGPPDPTVWW